MLRLSRIGGFLEISKGKPGPWFSLEVDRALAPWAFAKGHPKKVIAALELLATLVGIRLWRERIENPRDWPSGATRITNPTRPY